MNILYNILTCEKFLNTRCKLIKDSWLKNLDEKDEYVFLSSKENLDENIIGYNTEDDYDNATYKYIEFFKNYELSKNIDFIFFCDDDIYIFTRELKKVLLNAPNIQAIGYKNIINPTKILKDNGKIKFPMVSLAGGAGFGISKDAFCKIKNYILTENYPIFLHGDVSIASWINENNIPVEYRNDILRYDPPDGVRDNEIKDKITYHYCKQDHFERLKKYDI